MNGTYSLIALSLVLITCSACGDQQNTSSSPSAGPSAEVTPELTPESAPTSNDMTRDHRPGAKENTMTPQQQIDHAQADLANRLGLNPADVSVVSSGHVTWRSGALGCPQPGMNYTQALVPGFQITLQAGKTTYHYHAKSGGQPFHCPQNRIEPPATSSAYE